MDVADTPLPFAFHRGAAPTRPVLFGPDLAPRPPSQDAPPWTLPSSGRESEA